MDMRKHQCNLNWILDQLEKRKSWMMSTMCVVRDHVRRTWCRVAAWLPDWTTKTSNGNTIKAIPTGHPSSCYVTIQVISWRYGSDRESPCVIIGRHFIHHDIKIDKTRIACLIWRDLCHPLMTTQLRVIYHLDTSMPFMKQHIWLCNASETLAWTKGKIIWYMTRKSKHLVKTDFGSLAAAFALPWS